MKQNGDGSDLENSEWVVITKSETETKKLGYEFGEKAPPNTIFFMTGDLGSGKTTFAQGFALGMEVPKEYYITSPTYTLIHEYPGRVPFFHADLYRIDTQDAIEEIGLPEIMDSEAVLLIEWADKIKSFQVQDYIHIHLLTMENNDRKFIIIAYGLKCKNLVKEFLLKHKEK